MNIKRIIYIIKINILSIFTGKEYLVLPEGFKTPTQAERKERYNFWINELNKHKNDNNFKITNGD